MKSVLAPISALLAALAIAAPILLFPVQRAASARIVSVEPVKGVVTARETKTGRTFQFALPANVAAGLKPGDAVTADLAAMKVATVKGVAQTAQIREPDGLDPCCNVVAFASDGVALEALLRGLSGAEPVGANRNQGDSAEPLGDALKSLLSSISNAEPVGAMKGGRVDFRSIIKGAEMRHDIIDLAEPVNGIVVARDLTTGAHHVVMMTGTPPAGAVGSAMMSGGGVSIDEENGLAMFRANNQTYSYPLYRPYATQGAGAQKGPWVITPNAQLRGIMGRLVTKFHPQTDGTARMVYVYTPGTEEEVSHAITGDPQEIVEGEYDVRVMNVTVPNVPIKKGNETRILIGALTFAAASANSLNYVYDATGQKELFLMIGKGTTSVPVGTYSIKVGARVVKFEIKDGELTEL